MTIVHASSKFTIEKEKRQLKTKKKTMMRKSRFTGKIYPLHTQRKYKKMFAIKGLVPYAVYNIQYSYVIRARYRESFLNSLAQPVKNRNWDFNFNNLNEF